jgi:hypothetical protein
MYSETHVELHATHWRCIEQDAYILVLPLPNHTLRQRLHSVIETRPS